MSDLNINMQQPSLTPLTGGTTPPAAPSAPPVGVKTGDVTKVDTITAKEMTESQNIHMTGTTKTPSGVCFRDTKSPALPPPAKDNADGANSTTALKGNQWFAVSFLAVFDSIMAEVVKLEDKIKFTEGELGMQEKKLQPELLKQNIEGIKEEANAEAMGHLADAISAGFSIGIAVASMYNTGRAAKKAKNNPEVKEMDEEIKTLKTQRAEIAAGEANPTRVADNKAKLNNTLKEHDVKMEANNKKTTETESKISAKETENTKKEKTLKYLKAEKENAFEDKTKKLLDEKTELDKVDPPTTKSQDRNREIIKEMVEIRKQNDEEFDPKINAKQKEVDTGKTELTKLRQEKKDLEGEKTQIKADRDKAISDLKAPDEATKAKLDKLDAEIGALKQARGTRFNSELQTIGHTDQYMNTAFSKAVEMVSSIFKMDLAYIKGDARVKEAQAQTYSEMLRTFIDNCQKYRDDAKGALDDVIRSLEKTQDSVSNAFKIGA